MNNFVRNSLDVIDLFMHQTKRAFRIFRHGKSLESDFYLFGMKSVKELITSVEDVVFVDVGGYKGTVSEWVLSNVGSIKSVVIFEPFYENYNKLKDKFRTKENVEVVNKAVSSFVGSSNLNVFDHKGLNSLCAVGGNAYSFDTRENSVVTPVDVISLDSYFDDSDSQFFVKVDVQGAELDVLKGMVKLFESDRILGIIIEISVVDFYESQSLSVDLIAYISQYNFVIKSINYGYFDRSMSRPLEYDFVFAKI